MTIRELFLSGLVCASILGTYKIQCACGVALVLFVVVSFARRKGLTQ